MFYQELAEISDNSCVWTNVCIYMYIYLLIWKLNENMFLLSLKIDLKIVAMETFLLHSSINFKSF